MCGIIAVIAKRKVVSILVAGLKSLAYRGYDSAGVALFDNNLLTIFKAEGKIENLEHKLENNNINNDINHSQNIGIGHTRWATHGKPTEINSHPHVANNRLAVVHNGIIDNYLTLKKELLDLNLGYKFHSDTDTEVIAVWLYHQLTANNKNMLEALSDARNLFAGNYSFIVLDKNQKNTLYALQCGSPLVFGLGIDEYYAASDIIAFQSLTSKYIYSKPGDISIITDVGIKFFDLNNHEVTRDINLGLDNNLNNKLSNKLSNDPKAGYKHFMLKEIMEQPDAIYKTIESCFYNNKVDINKSVESIHIVACGTSYYAGCVAKYWFEKHLNIPVSVEIASEYRYRDVAVAKNTVLILISQSGETADTLAVLREARDNKKYLELLSICNVNHSTLVNESDGVCLTQAGPEYGVASTKAFTTQLIALCSLINTQINTQNILNIKNKIQDIFNYKNKIQLLAKEIYEAKHALFLGRGDLYPIALEGALKLKEISYIHAEAYAGGELKHGPLALVDSHMPVIVLVDKNNHPEKICSNIQEVQARGGRVFIFTNDENISDKISLQKNDRLLNFSDISYDSNIDDNILLTPILFVIILQLLAYYTADYKGTDIDQPRNLAKSVTVE